MFKARSVYKSKVCNHTFALQINLNWKCYFLEAWSKADAYPRQVPSVLPYRVCPVLLAACPEALISAEYKMRWLSLLLCDIIEAYREGCRASLCYATSAVTYYLHQNNLVVSDVQKQAMSGEQRQTYYLRTCFIWNLP